MDNEGYVFQHKISLPDLWKQIARAAGVDPSYPRLGSLFGLKVRVGSEMFVVPRVAATLSKLAKSLAVENTIRDVFECVTDEK